MEANGRKNTEGKKEPVILMLPGFDKKWVFKSGEGWIEYLENNSNIEKTAIEEPFNEDNVEFNRPKKKWWQFWKK